MKTQARGVPSTTRLYGGLTPRPLLSKVIPFDRTVALEVDLMTVSTPQAKPANKVEPHTNRPIPPLENGDRRYEAMPQVNKAELIEGIVYMPSPVRSDVHGAPHSQIGTWLGYYAANTPGVSSYDNSTVRLDLANEPQPDVFLRIRSPRIGQSKLTDDGYTEGPPELTAEVAATSASYDLGAKLEAYRRNGVREYIVWRVLDEAIDWFVLRDDRYEPMAPAADGILRSAVFPGLWLDAAALLTGDLAKVFEVLKQGIESEEHAAFVKRLGEDALSAP